MGTLVLLKDRHEVNDFTPVVCRILFTHVTVVPLGTVTLAGLNAKFWILTIIAPGTCACVVAGGVEVRFTLTSPIPDPYRQWA